MVIRAPMTIQYQAKGLKCPFSKIRKAGLTIAIPIPNEDKKPIKQEEKEKEMGVFSEKKSLVSSRRFPPITVGIAKRKENWTASCDVHPNTLAQEIVEALLEMPGIRAAP